MVTTKSTYYDSISKQPCTIFAPKKLAKKELVIHTNEGQSFAETFSEFCGKTLELNQVMHGHVTEKHCNIVNESDKAKSTVKSIFRNLLQQNSTVRLSSNVPADTKVLIIDAMRVARMVPIKKLKPRTFRRWANDVFKYIKHLPDNTVHIVFDNYTYEYNVPTKDWSTGAPRVIANIDQEFPNDSEWVDFLGNSNSKSQLMDILLKYLLKEYQMDKDILVNNRHTTYLKAKSWKTFKAADELYSQHKEADHKIVSQTVFESKKGNKTLVVAYDSDIFILLLWAASSFKSDVFFRQGKSSDKEGILYTEIYSLAEQLGEDVCKVLPAFHVLTGSDYTSFFFGKTKYTCFKRMIAHPESCFLLKSLNHPNANIGEVIEFVVRIIYNRPKSEKTLGDARYNMLFIKSKDKKKFASTKCLPPGEISLALKIKRDN